MKIIFIGMSNSGKTYWSKKLKKEKGFLYFGCDDFIQKKLNLKSIEDLSNWLGLPHEKKYIKNSQIYLRYEEEATKTAINLLKKEENKNIVIDTTGSIVHLPLKYLQDLSRLGIIIYLKIPEKEVKKMIQLYFTHPKPVIWGNFFKKKKDDHNPIEKIKKSYPQLLSYRQKVYQKFAHLVLDCLQLRNSNYTSDDFLEIIKKNAKIS